jgi:hypothetical protein
MYAFTFERPASVADAAKLARPAPSCWPAARPCWPDEAAPGQRPSAWSTWAAIAELAGITVMATS